mmetsp:Transcript_13616/g.28464  ORF Transcript_13616/g.28464 Transcript_13616/m.28464 type:complete len:395 (+) Transcript_13616:3-1187(+)
MGTSCSGCHAGESGSAASRPPGPGGCHCSLGETEQVRTRLRVGCSASVLDAPVELALAKGHCEGLNVSLNWVQCPPCAGAVMSMLSAGLVDMALMHTEDAVAFAAEGNPLRLCGTFVATPRTWGLYVNRGRGANVRCGLDMRGGTLGMPDDKGTSLALCVFGDAPGWSVLLYCPRRPFSSLRRAANAMAKDATRATIWEQRAARPAVAAGEWELMATTPMPWPSLLLVASKEALYAKAGAVKRFIRFARTACLDFMARREEEAMTYIASRYGLSAMEARSFVENTEWVCDCKVDLEAIARPLSHLRRTGLLAVDRDVDPSRLLAKGLCTFSSDPEEPQCSVAASPRKVFEEEDFDFGFPAEPAAAELVAESDRAGAEQFVVKGPKEDYVPVPAG